MAGTVLLMRDDAKHPRAEIAFGNGDRVLVSLDGNGLAVRHSGSGETIFEATPDLVARFCAGLIARDVSNLTPLRVLTAAVIQLESAEQVGRMFRGASEKAA
jgi:hypothetical protein